MRVALFPDSVHSAVRVNPQEEASVFAVQPLGVLEVSRREGATATAAAASVVRKGGNAPHRRRRRHPRRARRHSRGLPSGRPSASSPRASTAPSAAAPQYRLSTAAPRSACLKGSAASHGEGKAGVGGENGASALPWVEARLSFSFPNFSASVRSSELDAQAVLLARRSAEPGRLKASPPAVAQCEKRRREPLTDGGCLGRPAPSALLFTCLVPPAAPGPTSFLLPLLPSVLPCSGSLPVTGTRESLALAPLLETGKDGEAKRFLPASFASLRVTLPCPALAPLRGPFLGRLWKSRVWQLFLARSDPTAAPP